ncbi:DUF4041 domain-containing protein [Brachybacterium sp. Z12]|uniref:DUF4041 domain-containing protein n=1 Tax=Brachybacterium sp. Z12 TaxID=2759167 RepID=UPI001861F93D|nr:DUF4041 domain-containing protein [Brachybacterium sp. Z12]QNN82846.1 DUF4041 domain-containing protein [Brachybacterium sp. Z12]
MKEQDITPPGWYPDPSGRHEMRWWDSTRWRDAVTDHGARSDDPLPPVQPAQIKMAPVMENFPEAHVASPPEVDARAALGNNPEAALSAAATAKVTMFSAKKIATDLQAETKILYGRVEALERVARELGGLEAADVSQRIDALREREAEQRARLSEHERAATALKSKLQDQISRAEAKLATVERDIIIARDRIELEARGLYDYEHVAEASASLASELADVRAKVKESNKYDKAIHAATGFVFNDSTAKGKTFVNQMRRIMLRAYNAEAENAVKTVKTGNLAPAIKRLTRAKEQIEKQGTMIDLSVDHRYHRLRLQEIDLAARHQEAVAADKALDRERREELREQRRAEQELRAEKELLEKERSHYLNSISRLRAAGDVAQADELLAKLSLIDEEIAQADYRAANIRAGYVYVISNIGAFGEGVVKIGMTRRLDPMDRVKELGDASVPFTFDVHALFFANDAVGIEAQLHRDFSAQRLNQVNTRKEFFRVTPEEVLESLRKQNVSVLEFRTDAEADDYRTSQAILGQQSSGSKP